MNYDRPRCEARDGEIGAKTQDDATENHKEVVGLYSTAFNPKEFSE